MKDLEVKEMVHLICIILIPIILILASNRVLESLHRIESKLASEPAPLRIIHSISK